MPHCVVCGNPFKVNPAPTSGSAWHGSEAATLILPGSGLMVKDLLINVFQSLDPDLCARLRGENRESYGHSGLAGSERHGNCKAWSHAAICRTCYRLSEQIDEYETRVNKSKENLVFRREKYVSVYRHHHPLDGWGTGRLNDAFAGGGLGGAGGADFDDDVIGTPLTKTDGSKPDLSKHHDLLDKFLPNISLEEGPVTKQELPDDDDGGGLLDGTGVPFVHDNGDGNGVLDGGDVEAVGGGGKRSKRNAVMEAIVKLEAEEYDAYEIPELPYSDGGGDDDDDYDYKAATKPKGKKRGPKPGSKRGPKAGSKKAAEKAEKAEKASKKSRTFIKASDDPLAEGMKARVKADCLIVSNKTRTPEEVEAFIETTPDPALMREVLRDLDQDIDDYKQYLPSICLDQETAVCWDIVQLKTEEPAAMKHVVPGGLTCFVCSIDFERFVDKLDHILDAHSDYRPYECSACVQPLPPPAAEGGEPPPPLQAPPTFNSEKAAYDHVCENHDYKDPDNLTALKTSREPEEKVLGKFSCRHCPLVSTSKLGYWYHWWKRHFKYKQQPCPIGCNGSEPLGSATDFRRHVLFHHFEYRFSCPQCETFETQTKECIVRHMAKHDDFKQEDGGQALFPKKVMVPKRERKKKDKDDKDGGGGGGGDKKPLKLGMNVCAPMALRKARANSKVPLNLLEKMFVNPDHALITTTESQLGMASFPAPMRTFFEHQLDLLKTAMPSLIDSVQVDRDWATVMYKVGTFKLTYGIPGEFRCMECGEEFNEVSEKYSHVLEKHEGNGSPFFCEECPPSAETGLPTETFSVEANARTHMKTMHKRLQKESPTDDYDHDPIPLVNANSGATTYKCKFCAITCVSEFAYWYHVAASHKMFKSGRCPDCRQVLVGPKQFRHHLMVTHAMHRFQCPECEEKNYNSALLFQRHIKTHMVKVKDSTETGDAQNKFSLHMAKRVKRADIKCDICSMAIKNENAFARHMLSLHEIKIPVQCKVCKMTLEDPRALEAHKKSEHGVGSCHYCGKSFFVKGDLIAHIEKIHEGKSNEKSLMCEICSKSFNTIFQLKTHKVIHKEKTLKCQVCPKVFHWKSSLESHMIACHMNNGPKKVHTCEFCGKSFADKSNYRSHRFTHTQEKPYNCAGCGKGFIRKDVLRTHLKSCTVK